MVPARGDLPDFFWPMKSYTAQRWLAGTPPLWNPLSGCGEPWLAQLQTGVFYPGDAPFFLPWPYGPLVGIALHLMLAAAGVAAWLDHLGASRAASLAGAAVYAAGGAFLSLFPVYNNACTAAWLPWVFLGARRLFRSEGVAGFAVASALSFLAGEPALAVAGSLAALVVAAVTRREGEHLVLPLPTANVVGSVLLAAGLAAVAALPFVEHVVASGRIQSATRGEALGRAVQAGDLLDVALPARPDVTRNAGVGRGGYLFSLALGPAVLLLAAGAAAGFPGRGRLLLALFLVGLVGFLLSLGERGLLTPLLYKLGLFKGLRFPARWFVFPHLVLAMAAGAGLDGWLYGRFSAPTAEEDPDAVAERRHAKRARLFALAGLALTVLVLTLALGDGARDKQRAAAVLGVAVLAGILVAAGRAVPRFASATIVLVVAGSLVWVARDPLEPVPAKELAARAPIVKDLPPGASGRLFTTAADTQVLMRYTMPKGWTTDTPRLGRSILSGYHNLTMGIATVASASPIENLRRSLLVGTALSGGDPILALGLVDGKHLVSPYQVSMFGARLMDRSGGVFRYELPKAVGRAFYAKSARVASDDEVAVLLRAPDLTADGVAFLAEAPGPLPPGGGAGFHAAKVKTDLPEKLEIQTNGSSAAVLVVTRSYDPGWKATLDGKPARLVRANLSLMAVVVPGGEHQLVLTYRPLSFVVGAALSGFSLLVLVGLLLAGAPPVRR